MPGRGQHRRSADVGTVTVCQQDDGLAFTWSWGMRIGDASDPDTAAAAVAYVLPARDAQLGP